MNLSKFFILLSGLFLLFSFDSSSSKSKEFTCALSHTEHELFQLINLYRSEHKLPNIPLSKSLSFVAQQHCLDLIENQPHIKSGCNLHSWSDKGPWSSCCYTANHAKASCMWSKPSELTNYTGSGYEIAYSASIGMNSELTAKQALSGWQQSKLHNEVLLNQGIWKNSKWNAIGIGLKKGYAMVWFGEELDPDGSPD